MKHEYMKILRGFEGKRREKNEIALRMGEKKWDFLYGKLGR